MGRVFIGVGHGGRDGGACANGLQEKDVNLVMALAMMAELGRHGVEVGISRTTDLDDTLAQEVAKCGAFAPDLAVEVHNNAGGGKGFEVYQQQSGSHAAKSGKLAKAIEARVLELGQDSRGLKGEWSPGGYRFGWLTGCACPAVLCEGAFLDNASDMQMINTQAKQQAFGVAYAKGVLDYLKLAVKDAEENTANSSLTHISGPAQATAAQMRAFLMERNPGAPDYTALYLEEGEAEGIRGDVAFAQSCLETGYWKFGGDVKAEQNNFCGLGATGGGEPGCSFSTPREGIRAQIQHLKAYANVDDLQLECVDPRFKYVQRGTAPYVEHLGQKENPQGFGWATAVGYGAKILSILESILATEAPEEPGNMVAELQKKNTELQEKLDDVRQAVFELATKIS